MSEQLFLQFVVILLSVGNTDAHAVQVVLGERLYAAAMAAVRDTVGCDALILESLHNNVGTLGGQTVVDAVVTGTCVSITVDLHLGLRILVHVVDDVLKLLLFLLHDNGRVDGEENVAAQRLNLLDDGLRLNNRLRLNNGLRLGNNHGRRSLCEALTKVDLQTYSPSVFRI